MPGRPQFTPEQIETLKLFADHVRSGRHFLSFVFKVVALIGAIATAVLAYATLWQPHS